MYSSKIYALCTREYSLARSLTNAVERQLAVGAAAERHRNERIVAEARLAVGVAAARRRAIRTLRLLILLLVVVVCIVGEGDSWRRC